MTTETKACELWIAMNEDGDWIVTTEESDALSDLIENQGGYYARVVKVIVRMTPPVVPETTVDVPDDVGTVEVQPDPDFSEAEEGKR